MKSLFCNRIYIIDKIKLQGKNEIEIRVNLSITLRINTKVYISLKSFIIEVNELL